MAKEWTEAELTAYVAGLGREAAAVVCALIGHSRVQSQCFGYYSCERCETQIGDTLGSSYPGAASAVVLDHHCDTCRDNAKALTWRDTFMLPQRALDYLALLADVKRSRQRAAAIKRRGERAMERLRASVALREGR
jgi:hypothetical protein